AEIRLALGETPEPGALRARWCQGVARRFLLPAPGTVTSVRGAAEAAAGEGIALLEVVATPGQRIGPPGGRGCHGGVVIAVDETREGALRRAEAAAARARATRRRDRAARPCLSPRRRSHRAAPCSSSGPR